MTHLHQLIEELERLDATMSEGPWHIGHINESDDTCEVEDVDSVPVAFDVERHNEGIATLRNRLPEIIAVLKLVRDSDFRSMRDLAEQALSGQGGGT